MPETALGFDPDFAMAYGAQPQHKNDGLPWLVDDRGAGGGSKGLKEFIAAEAERGQGPGRVHLPADVIGTVQRNGDRWECAFVFQGQQCLGTGDTRDGAIMAAAKYVTGKTTEPETRELTEGELAYVGSLATAGRLVEGIEKFLSLSIAKKGLSPRTILSDSKYAEVCDRAVWHVWAHSTHEYSLADDTFPFFLEKFARGKRFSIELLNTAWKIFKEQSGQQKREAIVAAKFGDPKDPAAIRAQLDEMSDSEVQDQFHKTMKHAARMPTGINAQGFSPSELVSFS